MENHYEYGIISNNELVLFNNSIQDASLLHSDFLKDVNVNVMENGVLEVTAKKIEYDFYNHLYGRRIFEEDWQRTPHPKEIKEGKRHFWSNQKERYIHRGWIRTTELVPVNYMLGNFKVTIYD